MKSALLVPVAALVFAGGALAQKAPAQIWRCGNSYTNDAAEAKAKGCKLVEGGNVTVVEGTKVNGGNVKLASAPPRANSDEQRARDAESRSILDAELKKAEARYAELVKEYNNGEPEMLGPEHRNRAKYDERVAQLKEAIARSESDIAGIKRELQRAGGNGTVPAKQ